MEAKLHPADYDGIERFMRQCLGIGAVRARRLTTYSDWVLDALRGHPDALALVGGKLELHSAHTTGEGRCAYVTCPLDGRDYRIAITRADPPEHCRSQQRPVAAE